MKTATITPDPRDKHFSIVTVMSRGRVSSQHYILTGDAQQWRGYLQKKIKGSIAITDK